MISTEFINKGFKTVNELSESSLSKEMYKELLPHKGEVIRFPANVETIPFKEKEVFVNGAPVYKDNGETALTVTLCLETIGAHGTQFKEVPFTILSKSFHLPSGETVHHLGDAADVFNSTSESTLVGAWRDFCTKVAEVTVTDVRKIDVCKWDNAKRCWSTETEKKKQLTLKVTKWQPKK